MWVQPKVEPSARSGPIFRGRRGATSDETAASLIAAGVAPLHLKRLLRQANLTSMRQLALENGGSFGVPGALEPRSRGCLVGAGDVDTLCGDPFQGGQAQQQALTPAAAGGRLVQFLHQLTVLTVRQGSEKRSAAAARLPVAPAADLEF